MGARGKGAITKPKPPKKANGRPRSAVPDDVYEKLREPTSRAIETLNELQEAGREPKPEDRMRYLAASKILECGIKPPPPVLPDPNQKPQPIAVEVVYTDPNVSTTVRN